jgi:hypothetical protein
MKTDCSMSKLVSVSLKLISGSDVMKCNYLSSCCAYPHYFFDLVIQQQSYEVCL